MPRLPLHPSRPTTETSVLRRRLACGAGLALFAAALPAGAADAEAAPDFDASAALADLRGPEITVIGSEENLQNIAGSGQVIDSYELQRSHVFTTNEALRKVPGLYVRDEEGFGLRPNIGIRGLNPTRSTKTLLLEDGLPLSFAPYGDNASYYHPPIDRFDRIEVLKGSSQILFGPHTIGGTINYVTPAPPEEPGGTIDVSGGNLGTYDVDLSAGGTWGDTGLLAHATRKATDGARDNQRLRVSDLNLKWVQAIGERQSLTVRGSFYDEDSQVAYSGLTLAEFNADRFANPFVNDDFQTHRWGFSATHSIELAEGIVLRTSAYGSHFSRDWWRQSSTSAQRPNDASDPACGGLANLSTTCGNEGRLRDYYTTGFEPRLTIERQFLGMSSTTDLGFRGHFEEQRRRQLNGDRPNSREAGTGPNAGVREDQERDVTAWSGFIQNRFQRGRFGLTPGVRVESVSYERTNLLNRRSGASEVREVIPGVGATFQPLSGTTVFAGVHRGFAPPGVADIVDNNGGSVELDAELSWNYEVGLRTRPNRHLGGELTWFRMDFENQIIPQSVAGGLGATLTSAGETLHQGLELGARADWNPDFEGSVHNVFGRVAWTWLADAEFVGQRFSSIPGFGAVSVTGNRLPYAPEQVVNAAVGWEHASGFDLQLEAVYTSEVFGDDLETVAITANGQRGQIEDYTIFNLAANFRVPNTTLTAYGAVKNLLDEEYIADLTRGILPGLPRLVEIGVRLQF